MLAAPASLDDPVDVLFIGDDVDVADLYRLKLQLDGYEVRVVPPSAAVAAARSRRPEIVFVDVASASAERLQVLQAVRAATQRPDLPAILVTRAEAPDPDHRWSELTAYDYVIAAPAPRSPLFVS